MNLNTDNMKIVTGILAENMRRFATKNLNELDNVSPSQNQQNSEEPINEAYVEYGGVRITPASDGTGRVILSYETNKIYYKIKAKVKKIGITFYDGPIAVAAAWKNKKGESWIKDNTGKLFMLDLETLKMLASKAKTNQQTIAFTGTGEINGVSGDYTATLTKSA
jgi:hypothetical protein